MEPCLKRWRVSKHPIDNEFLLLHAEAGSEYILSLEAEVSIGCGAVAELDLNKVYYHLARS